MIKKVKAGWQLMQAGKMVQDPAKWKARQVTSSMIVAFMWAAITALSEFGIEVPIDAEAVDYLAVSLLAGINFVLTFSTTEKIGLFAQSQASELRDTKTTTVHLSDGTTVQRKMRSPKKVKP